MSFLAKTSQPSECEQSWTLTQRVCVCSLPSQLEEEEEEEEQDMTETVEPFIEQHDLQGTWSADRNSVCVCLKNRQAGKGFLRIN